VSVHAINNSIRLSCNKMNISSIIDHMFERYIGKNCYSIIYLETDILTIINRHDIINLTIRIYLTGKGYHDVSRIFARREKEGIRNNFYAYRLYAMPSYFEIDGNRISNTFYRNKYVARRGIRRQFSYLICTSLKLD